MVSSPQGFRAVGLDYAAASEGLKLAGIEPTPELWGQVRLIETGAIGALNEG